MAAQSEALAARQPSGADAADRTSEEDLALSWRMLQTLLASSQQMGDRLLFIQRSERWSTNSYMRPETIGYVEVVSWVRGGTVLRLALSRLILAFQSWVLDSVRRWQESATQKPQASGLQPFLTSPAFLVAELRWQWHLMVGQPIGLAAVTAACFWAWLGPVDKTIVGTLILATFAGVLWLFPFQASPGVPGRHRFEKLVGIPMTYAGIDAALNVFFNALAQGVWPSALRAVLLGALLFASLSNVVVVLASWKFLPVEVSVKQVALGMHAAAYKLESLLDRKESRPAKDTEPPAPGQ